MVPQLRLTLLGGFSISIADQPIKELTSRKAQALLCYIAVTRRTYTRTVLAGLFWPDMPEANARMNLRKELAGLRNTVAPYLRIERDSIAMEPKSNVWVDVVAFMTLVDGLPNTPLATDQLEPLLTQQLNEVKALYTGDFLDGFYILNAPPFEKWVLLQRSRLRSGMIQALETMAELAMQQHNYDQSIAITQQLLTFEPWREAAHRRLMKVLAWQGERRAALTQYEICQQLLADELDVEPEHATVSLYEQIRDGTVGKLLVEPPDHSPVIHSLVMPRRDNLPTSITPLLGREEELDAVAQFFADDEVRLVTILGPGGMGKTRLALEVASRAKDEYQHGVYLVELAPLSDPESMVMAIAASIGYTFYNDGRSERQEIIAYLHDRRMLLLLDNAEHLLAGVDFFVEILQAAPAVDMLVTSRERLQLSSETIFHLAGLPIADAAVAETSAAVQLFIQTARRAHPSFTPTAAADLAAIVEVCQLVSGMPLGLILAASWIEMLSPAEIAAEIAQGLDFLAVDLRDLPERQRSMEAVFETTWQRLSLEEQSAFKQLAIFRGGFTREASQVVTGTTLLTLTSLSHKSLILRTCSGRYEIHELLRQFAITRLAEQADVIYDAHSAYYCVRLQQWENDLKGRRQQEALEEIEADNENIRLAWQWAVKSRKLSRLAPALESLGLSYLWQNRFNEGVILCQQAVDTLFSASTAHDQELSQPHYGSDTSTLSDWIRFEIRLRVWLSTFKCHLLETESARQIIRDTHHLLAHDSVVNLDLRFEHALLLLEEAEINLMASIGTDPQQIQSLIEQSLVLFRLLDEQRYIAQALSLLSELLRRQGLLQQAQLAGEEGLALQRKLGDKRGIADSLDYLMGVFQWMGKFDEAETLARQSIVLSMDVRDQRHLADGLNALSRAMLHGGKFTECMEQIEESVRIRRQMELPTVPGFPTVILCFALMHLGRYPEAQQQQRQALLDHNQIIDEVDKFFDVPCESGHRRPKWPKPRATISLTASDMHHGLGYMWKDLGRTELALGMDDKAYHYLQEASQIFRSVTDFNGLGQALGCLGFLAYKHQAYEQAQEYIQKNLEISVKSNLFLPSLTALSGVALMHTVSGDPEMAVELYTLLQQHKHVANSRWFADVVGSHITAAAVVTMSPAALAKAEDRGRQRELFATIKDLTLPDLLASRSPIPYTAISPSQASMTRS